MSHLHARGRDLLALADHTAADYQLLTRDMQPQTALQHLIAASLATQVATALDAAAAATRATASTVPTIALTEHAPPAPATDWYAFARQHEAYAVHAETAA